MLKYNLILRGKKWLLPQLWQLIHVVNNKIQLRARDPRYHCTQNKLKVPCEHENFMILN